MNKGLIVTQESKAAGASSRPKFLYPALIVAAVSVTLLSLTGVAAMTGMLPGAHAKAEEEAKMAAARCTNCGVVESVRMVTLKGQASGLGAVAGGVVGGLLGNQVGKGNGRTAMTVVGAAGGAYAGNEIEKNTKSSNAYQIRIQMNDGATRTITTHQVPDVHAGDRVRVSNGSVVRMY